MASSEVEICNSALIKVGADRIISLTDDTERARVVAEQYPKARDEMLRAHPWNFAIARVELGSTGTPEFEFDNEFLLPSDCLRVLKTDLGDDDEYKIEGRKLLTNNSSIKIKYIKRITDVSMFDASFTEVLAIRLAYDIAYRITNSSTQATALYQLYSLALRDARSFDAQEGSADRIISDEWLNSRF